MKIENLVRQNLLSLSPYSSARDEFTGKEGIFLDANENPFGNLNRYPDPHQRLLKEKLSEVKNIPAQNIFIGNGSDEVIDLVFRLFCEPAKDKALTFSPTYGMYEVSAKINDIGLKELPLNEDFQIDFEAFEKEIQENTYKLILVCSPNNPTGNIINDIERILKTFNGIIFVDEAYSDFRPEKSLQNLIHQYPNLIVSQTFSKAWGLASARVGIALAQKETIDWLDKIKPPYNVSQLNQNAAIQALENIETFKNNRKTILQEKEKLINELSQLDLVQKIYPSDANFVLIKTIDANGIYNQLVSKHIIIRNRAKIIENCLRITVGSPEENQTLLDELKNIRI